MLDQFERQINYLRISVTDRCNLRCIYCMPEHGVELLQHKDILSFEEIEEVVRIAVQNGFNKIRLTGGEPLVRKGITSLIKQLNAIEGINDLSLTTNGILLKDFAAELKSSGLNRINISLDTCDPDKFKEFTRGGDIKLVVAGIVAAQKAGLFPIKINCVVESSGDEPDALGVRVFCEKMGLQLRLIYKMNLGHGKFSIVDGGTGGDCSVCNRLRLTANGKIKPCLFNDIEFDVRTLGAAEALESAIRYKPECGTFNSKNSFYNIGG